MTQSADMSDAAHLMESQVRPVVNANDSVCSQPVCETAAREGAPLGDLPASGRDTRGRFTPGNLAAMTHGGRSMQVAAGVLPSQADAMAVLGEREAAILADLGGVDVISTIKRGAVTRHCRWELIEDYCWRDIATKGISTTKGHTRATVSLLLQVQDRLHRSAQLLGLDRQARPVPSVNDLLRSDQG